MTDTDTLATIRIEWTPADHPVVQAAEMAAYQAAYPTAAGDPSELDDFRL